MTRVLVTGANGQLGKTIKELFEENDIDLEFVFVSKAALDITDKDNVDIFFKDNSFDYCINCAAYTNVEQAEKTPEIAYNVNGKGAKNLAEICQLNNIILIHVSTDYVFDGEKETPYTTSDETNPINEYGKSKLKGEEYIKEISSKYFIIRTSWLYSKKHGKNFYKTILAKTEIEKELYITNQQTGCPTDTVNLANHIIKLIKNRNSSFGIYHFRDFQIMTWYDFAKKIVLENNKSNYTKILKSNSYITQVKRPKYSVLKID